MGYHPDEETKISDSQWVKQVIGAQMHSAGDETKMVRESQSTQEEEEVDSPKSDEKGIIPADVSGNGSWQDGTYTGSAQGFRGLVNVKVTVENGKIASIVVVSAEGETDSYLTKAKALIPEMIEKQTTNVDVVSKATYSSNGIINATRAALQKAGNKEQTEAETIIKEETTAKAETTKTETTRQEDTADKKTEAKGKLPYIDGKYNGTGTGRNGEIKVRLTIKNKKIKSIVVISHDEDAPYFESAKAVLPQMLQKQSTKVDTVSGATLSSRGLIEAVKNALNEAKEATDKFNGRKDTSKSDTEENDNKDNGSDNKDDNESDGENRTEKSSEKGDEEKPQEQLQYEDGIYHVAMICSPDHVNEEDDYNYFKEYTIEMDVTIKQDKIILIDQITCSDKSNQWYVNTAQGMLTDIYINGTTEGVDTVSEATCSSYAILDACEEALNLAKKDDDNNEG